VHAKDDLGQISVVRRQRRPPNEFQSDRRSYAALAGSPSANAGEGPFLAALHVRRVGQQRLLPGLLGLRHQRAAMPVGCGDEASGHVVAEKCDGGGVAAVGHRQRTAGLGVVLGVGERRLRTEGDVRQIDAIAREGLGRPEFDAAAIDNRRVDDRGGPADAGGDAEVRRRVGADHIDARHHEATARDRQRPAADRRRVAEADRVGDGGNGDEVDELLVVRMIGLPFYFPKIARFAGNSRSDWFLAFLEQFPIPASIIALSKEQFIDQAWGVVGRKVSKARLLGDIYETARSSIGLPVTMDGAAITMFRLVVAEGRSLIRQRDAIEHQAHAALVDNPDYRRLRQIPGIGPIIAMTILAEAGDLRRFRHHRQFLKFCGLDLATHQSGQFRGQTKLSKFGNARLRRAFWVAAQVAVRQRDNSFRAKYERYVARDRDNADLKRKALTAITAKMARTTHAVIKTGSDYRPFFEGPMPSGRTSLSRCHEGATATL
jgi:hypothetical protein